MKTIKNIIFLIGATLFLVIAAGSSCAITDGTDDVYHWSVSGTSWSWGQFTGDKPNIDITSVDYSVSGSNITVTITVDGTIQTDTNVFYYVYLIGDTGKYFAYYYNNVAMWSGIEGYVGEGGMISQYTTNGNAISMTFSPNNPSSTFTIYGYAQEYTSLTDTETSEAWADYAPSTYAPWYDAGDGDTDDDTGDDDQGDDDTGDDDQGDDDTGNGDTGDSDTNDNTSDQDTGDDNEEDKGIPGFELLILIAAIGFTLIILRKRKK